MKKHAIYIDVTDVDWRLLRKQKAALVDAAGNSESPFLQGLVHFLDDIQDQAALCIGETRVFGKKGI